MTDTDITGRFHGGNPESHAAFESIREGRHLDRLRIVGYIAYRGQDGATCDEIEVALRLSHQTASARVTEAKARGEIVDSGSRRPTRSGRSAAVYVIPTPESQGELW